MNRNIPAQANRWLEIDLDVVAANYQILRDYLPSSVEIMAVVKADAYGYGAVAVSKVLAAAGVAALAVTTLDEAIELRQNGIVTPILVFAPILQGEAACFFDYDLMPTISNNQGLIALEAVAEGRSLNCHLKINTGMNRMGVLPEQLPDLLASWQGKPALKLAGVYSHFATALDNNPSFSKKQLQIFNIALAKITEAGFTDFSAHIANSAGALKFPESCYDMVRLGSILYGQAPIAKTFGLNLKDPFTAKAKIISIQEVAKGDSVGYGRDFIATKNMRLAVIPMGYADGFAVSVDARPLTIKNAFQAMSRDFGKIFLHRGKKGVLWNSEFLPVVGRVAMQSTVVDISGVKAALGQTVVVPLRRTAANARLPRFYFQSGKLVEATGITQEVKQKITQK